MDGYWSSLRDTAKQFSSQAKSAWDDAASELKERGVGEAIKETFTDAGHAVKEFGNTAARKAEQVANSAAAIFDDDFDDDFRDRPRPPPGGAYMAGAGAAAGFAATGAYAASSAARPRQTPAVPPRLGELRKGDKVFRRGVEAVVVKIDYEADPPALVVRMVEAGNEVGTDEKHASLGLAASEPCLAVGLRVCVVGLQSRPELNGLRGTVIELPVASGGVLRWSTRLDQTNEVIGVRPRNLSALLTPPPESPTPALSRAASAAHAASATPLSMPDAPRSGPMAPSAPCTRSPPLLPRGDRGSEPWEASAASLPETSSSASTNEPALLSRGPAPAEVLSHDPADFAFGTEVERPTAVPNVPSPSAEVARAGTALREAAPGEAAPTEAASAEAPAESAPAEAAPVEEATARVLVEVAPASGTHVEVASTEATPVQALSVDAHMRVVESL